MGGGVLAVAMLAGCSMDSSAPDDARTREADRAVRARWGKPLSELPTRTLVLISPHNENIRKEFEWAFSLHHAVEHGATVRIEWRDVGGGGSTITRYLVNVYRRSETSGIDMVWGGGHFPYLSLAKAGVFQPMTLRADVLANVPASLGGPPLYDKLSDQKPRWVGAVVSAFGFVYNRGLLDRCGIDPPKQWDDLGAEPLAGLIALADPTQSSSAAAAYQMMARSGESWPHGWAKLLRILSNAKRFNDSAGSAANAPLLGEALVAACIDFYGAMRVLEAPDQIVYVSPRGQTTFSPDPIAILKNPPHPELARRFVDFVMSARGQALWGLPVGARDGPVRTPLGRQPIRRDVYRTYGGEMLPSIVDPYRAGQAMTLEGFRSRVDYDVLKQLVRAAAVDNIDGLRAARGKLIAARHPPELVAEFNRLPENVATVDAMAETRRGLADETRRERITTDWQTFFRDKYRRIVRGDHD